MNSSNLIAIIIVLISCLVGVWLGREIASISITLAVWFIVTHLRS